MPDDQRALPGPTPYENLLAFLDLPPSKRLSIARRFDLMHGDLEDEPYASDYRRAKAWLVNARSKDVLDAVMQAVTEATLAFPRKQD